MRLQANIYLIDTFLVCRHTGPTQESLTSVPWARISGRGPYNLS